jgi:hypothetical protein
MTMLLLLMVAVALPGTDADATDLAARTTASRPKEHPREDDDFAYGTTPVSPTLPAPRPTASIPGGVVIIDLATASSPYRGSTFGNPNDISLCGHGPEQGFRYILAPGHGIVIGQTFTSFESMHTLRHGGQYPGKVSVDCVDAPGESQFLNDGVEDATVYFIVAASSSGEAGGAFTVEWLLYAVGQDQGNVPTGGTKLWPEPEPRPRHGRVLNAYTPLTDSNINTAANLWVSDQASGASTYGLVHTWDVSQVTSLAQTWCGIDDYYCGQAYLAMRSFNGDISMWDVSKVTSMYMSKSILM